MLQNTCAKVSEMQYFVTILVKNDDTFEAIFGNKIGCVPLFTKK